MKKKIAILSLHLGYGGVEKAITSLANSLAKLDKYEIEVVSIYNLYGKPIFQFNPKVKITYLINTDLPIRVSKYKICSLNFIGST